MTTAGLIQQYINCSPEMAVTIEMVGAYAAYRGGKEALKRVKDWVMSDRERINNLLASENITLLEKDESSVQLLEEVSHGGLQKRKEVKQAVLFEEGSKTEPEYTDPVQLDLFEERPEEAEVKSMRSKWGEWVGKEDDSKALIPKILADPNGQDTAVYLVSNLGLPEWNPKNIEAIRVARATRKVLMEHFSLGNPKLYMLFGATGHDLIDALENPNVDHVIIRGHGGWSSWEDNAGNLVTSEQLMRHVDSDHKKKSFIRETCGRPLPFDEYEDQFGAAFSRETIGQATLTHIRDHAQIKHTLRNDFARYKGMSYKEHDELFEKNQPLLRKMFKKLDDLGRRLF